jgi:hypothetical protein
LPERVSIAALFYREPGKTGFEIRRKIYFHAVRIVGGRFPSVKGGLSDCDETPTPSPNRDMNGFSRSLAAKPSGRGLYMMGKSRRVRGASARLIQDRC